MVWFNEVDVNEISPRGYDLQSVEQRADFIQDFKQMKAESILKRFVEG